MEYMEYGVFVLVSKSLNYLCWDPLKKYSCQGIYLYFRKTIGQRVKDCSLILHSRSELDTDDEVRDRATFYRFVLEEQQKALNSAYILNGKNFFEINHTRFMSNF